MAPHAFFDERVPRAIAHRGGGVEAPENSVAAFEASIAMGYTHVETDVHLTADGVLVAFHDDTLDRATDMTGEIARMSWTEVSRARIAGQEAIPTMAELLERFPDVRFNIEPKSDDSVVSLAALIRRHGAQRRVCVGSFSNRRLARMRALFDGDLWTAAGPRETAALLAAVRVRREQRRALGARRPRSAELSEVVAAATSGAYSCLQIPTRLGGVELATTAVIDAAHARGREVHVWTIDDADEMRRLLDLGVDGIMTDRPTVLRDVLVERGVWE